MHLGEHCPSTTPDEHNNNKSFAYVQYLVTPWMLAVSVTVCPVNYGLSPDFRWIVAGTTIWSGLSYVFSKDAVRILHQSRKDKKTNK